MYFCVITGLNFFLFDLSTFKVYARKSKNIHIFAISCSSSSQYNQPKAFFSSIEVNYVCVNFVRVNKGCTT